MKTVSKAAGGRELNVTGSVKHSCRQIKKLIQNFGPRAPGSPEELKAQQFMAKELKGWADTIETEEFAVHRQAFMGFIPFTVATGIASTFLFWFNQQLIGTILVVLGFLPLLLEFVMYRQFIDKLFKKHPSHNIIANRKASGETKRKIILIAHADSQYEWTLNYKLGGNGMKGVLIPAVVGFAVAGIANAVKMIVVDFIGAPLEGFWKIFFMVVGIALFCFIPFFIAFLFFQSPVKSVPGANDNLSGCYVAMSVLKELEENNIRFENTDVCVIISGSEEAGLRGAKAYVKAHKAELKEIETICIGLDTFRDLKDMAVYDRDMSGTLQHDKQVKELVRKAGENCGFEMPYASIYIGACDAAAFTQAGIKSTGFAAMDPTPPRYYHTRLDDWDMLEPDAIKAGIEICLETVCLYDENGLS